MGRDSKTCWRGQLQVALSIESSLNYRAFKAVGESHVDVVGYMGPIELTSHSVEHATLAEVSFQNPIMC